MKEVRNNIFYVGVNDHKIDLFEGQYVVENGMAYNSYVIMDKKIAIMDTVDKNFTHEWLDNIASVLNGKKPDYLIVQHMEPDHSANIKHFLDAYPKATVVGNDKTFNMMQNFFGDKIAPNRLVVKNNDTLNLGTHELTFVFAPMVHWPEVMVTYDCYAKTLFSADGFGKFGALDVDEEWDCEARRYYFGIVGKYGAQVQNLLKVAKTLDIEVICPLHGPILDKDLAHYINQYDTWSSYGIETDGVFIAYTSVYGNTKQAALELAEKLKEKGCPKVAISDLARSDMAENVEDAFRYGKIVLATTTYNAEIFPFMNEFINHLVERNYQNRTIGIIENGSWAPMAKKVILAKLEKCKNITYLENNLTIKSALTKENRETLDLMANELCKDYIAKNDNLANKHDLTALFKIGYGLYVITSNDGKKDNGFICNTVTQVTNNPNRVAVTINKDNYSHHIIKQTGLMNVNVLSVEAPFSVFEKFGFVSGRTKDKFEGEELSKSDNGLVYLDKYINSFMSLKVEQYLDLGTHGMFICSITESRVITDKETMTYSYYQDKVKPKPQTEGKKGYVCTVCGYIYDETDELPEDFVCPLCKHGASDFEKIK